MLAGLALLTAPLWWRLVADLTEERRERIRSQERADLAAHLHDSVLQTLALIQRHSDEPREVARLARGQERELRTWLYRPEDRQESKLAAALEAVAGEVEDAYVVQVESVVVGDAEVDDRLGAVVQATREALVNAAKHAGVGTISLYAEVEPEEVTVFVRDRGAGFDPDAGRRGPARRARVDRRTDGTARRQGDDPQPPRRRHGGRADAWTGAPHDEADGPQAEPRPGRRRPQPVRVVLVDDHSMFRSGVRAELAADSGVEIVGEAGGVGEAVAVIGRTKPDVVLLDVHMPDGGGKAVLEQVRKATRTSGSWRCR